MRASVQGAGWPECSAAEASCEKLVRMSLTRGA
jgi:hypothetical protein